MYQICSCNLHVNFHRMCLTYLKSDFTRVTKQMCFLWYVCINNFIPQSFLHPSFCYCDMSFTTWMIWVSMLLCLRHWLSGRPIKLLILWPIFRCSNFVCVSLVGRLLYSIMVHQLCKAVSYTCALIFLIYFCCIFLTQYI